MVTDSKFSDNGSDDVQRATASSAPAASITTFAWEDMNYVGQREQFVHNYGPQNEAQNETTFISGDTNKQQQLCCHLWSHC